MRHANTMPICCILSPIHRKATLFCNIIPREYAMVRVHGRPPHTLPPPPNMNIPRVGIGTLKEQNGNTVIKGREGEARQSQKNVVVRAPEMGNNFLSTPTLFSRTAGAR
ncbi:hypothetical protein AVEN_159325-1 [Araneus ventricosus]|uniref:Uncharacterized protein n=1 Tax=Araneus ventricosus TaxID=182803 RepID=A0A4Y2A1M9_ARAVE|nr:hypothetical protein AVEN_159325-1 [Araneus ventricosus]